jgi:quercetin dioxygenase-like cupin family protein
MRKYKNMLRLVVLAVMMSFGAVAPAIAAGKSQEGIQSVAQTYGTSKALQQGLIVQIDDKNKTNVTPATYKDSKKTFGVVVAPASAAVTLSSGSGEQAYVVTSGRYNVLVSNQNGTIKAGDFISISAASGIGMKADNQVDYTLGRAVTGFDGKTNVVSTTSLKKTDGQQVKVAFGQVAVDIAITPNSLKSGSENGVPKVIQDMAVSLVGKPISQVQLYASVIVLLVGVGIVASLLYGGIQTGMTAIGRNPLAKKSIMRNMIQVIATGLMIFAGCLVAVYLILKI